MSRRQVEINHIHALLHQGKVWTYSTFTSALASGGTIGFLISTSSGYPTHALFSCAGGGEASLELFENVTVSSTGALTPMINRRRSSAGTAPVTRLYVGPGASGSSRIFSHYVPGGNGPQSIGGSDATEGEMLLQTGFTLAIYTNLSNAAKGANLLLHLYEEGATS